MTISVWGRLKGKKPEKIDTASSRTEAAFLAQQYRIAFGKDWVIWAGRRNEEPCSSHY
jgi:hypothetical protein